MSDDGTRETLSFLDGETGYPPLSAELRSEQALISVANAVRRFHDASQGFIPPQPGRWHGQEVAAPVIIDCVGHHRAGGTPDRADRRGPARHGRQHRQRYWVGAGMCANSQRLPSSSATKTA